MLTLTSNCKSKLHLETQNILLEFFLHACSLFPFLFLPCEWQREGSIPLTQSHLTHFISAIVPSDHCHWNQLLLSPLQPITHGQNHHSLCHTAIASTAILLSSSVIVPFIASLQFLNREKEFHSSPRLYLVVPLLFSATWYGQLNYIPLSYILHLAIGEPYL